MGIEQLQPLVTNNLLVFRKPYLEGLESFRYTGENPITGSIDEMRFRAADFSDLQGYRFGGIVGGAQPSDYAASVPLWNDYFFSKWVQASDGIPALYFGFDVAPNRDADGRPCEEQTNLVNFLEAALGQGEIFDLTITDPFKYATFQYLDSIGATIQYSARRMQAVNHVLKAPEGYVYGYNSDGQGMFLALEQRQRGHDLDMVADPNILVIGAGGSAKAIVDSLISNDVYGNVVVLNRTERTANELAAKYPEARITSGGLDQIDDQIGLADIIIHTVTQGGISLDQASKSQEKALFVDTRYGPKAEFIDHAVTLNRPSENGKGMLFWQFVVALKKTFDRTFNAPFELSGITESGNTLGYEADVNLITDL